jgi:hypothetical protein
MPKFAPCPHGAGVVTGPVGAMCDPPLIAVVAFTVSLLPARDTATPCLFS